MAMTIQRKRKKKQKEEGAQSILAAESDASRRRRRVYSGSLCASGSVVRRTSVTQNDARQPNTPALRRQDTADERRSG